MFFFQPVWLQHGEEGKSRQPVFSVDVQAVGGRLATAGQDCRIRLWSCDALMQAGSLDVAEQHGTNAGEKEVLVTFSIGLEHGLMLLAKTSNDDTVQVSDSKKIPKGALLATLTYHAGAVNCVRFSPDGSLLASGGDDSVVLTYERLAGAGRSAAFGSGEGESVENWRCRKPLRAHLGDVTDLSWCSDSDRLCSASVDNTIYVWSARSEKALVKLEGHKGLVKGVAWDPIGKYVASQSDDKSVIIWRTSDWKIEKRITAPFADAVLHENNLSFFLRLSWSPCGSLLLLTNAYSKRTATHLAPMFSRESSLNEHIDFVGHKEPIVVARFSPRLYSETPTSEDAPVPNAKNPAYTCIALGSKDRGATLWRAGNPKPFVNLQDMFCGDVVDIAWGADGYTLVACSTDGGIMLIRFEPKELGYVVPPKVEQELYNELWQSFGGKVKENPLPESKIQVEMEKKLTSTGVKVQKSEEHNEKADVQKLEPQPAPVTKQSDGPKAEPTKAPRPIQPVRIAEAGEGNDSMIIIRDETTPTVADATAIVQEPIQREERGKGGKRRIIPQPLGAPVAAVSTDQTSQPAGNIWTALSQSESQATPTASLLPPAKRSRTQPTHELVGMITSSGGDAVQEMKAWVSDWRQRNVLPAASRLRGGARCRAIDTETPAMLLEASSQGASRTVMITCSRAEGVLWRDYIGASVVALAGIDGKYAAVATADAFMYMYSSVSGRRLAPPLSLDAPPHIFDMFKRNDRYLLLVVSRSAVVSLFDLEEQELVFTANAGSLLAKVTDGDEEEEGVPHDTNDRLRRGISVGSVSDLGEPILVLSDGHAFVHSKKLGSWLRIADDHAPNSEFYQLLPPPGDDSLLSKLQAGAAMTARKNGTATLPVAGMKRSAVESISHLETLMEASLALGSAERYTHYLKCYALRLGSNEAIVDRGQERMREICEKLTKSGEILGMKKSDLLRNTVLPAVSQSRRHQRLVEEFTMTLDELQRRKLSVTILENGDSSSNMN